MRPVRLIIVTSVLFLTLPLSLRDAPTSGGQGAAAGAPGLIGEALGQSFGERLRERRSTRRDRTSRRFSRGAADLVPHLADYVIHESGFVTGRFLAAQGQLTVDLTRHCQDWTLQESWAFTFRDQAGRGHDSDLLYRFTEAEAPSPSIFRYSRKHLEEPEELIYGKVLPDDLGFTVVFTEPKEPGNTGGKTPELLLSNDIIFPVTHLREVIASAKRGRRELEAKVFDGGNLLPYRAVTRIGDSIRFRDEDARQILTAETELDIQTTDRLPSGRLWPIVTEYFPPNDAYAPPVFKRDLLLHESGIMINFHLDFGDLRMKGKLKNLDRHEPQPCTRDQKRDNRRS